MNKLLLSELILTFCLVTLIWIIQLVHYPSFSYYDATTFNEAMGFHQQRISFIVMPLMLTEAALAGFLLSQDRGVLNGLGLALIAGIWLSTFLLQVPLHQQLLAGKDLAAIERLVTTNWIRTGLWSLKGLLCLWKVSSGG